MRGLGPTGPCVICGAADGVNAYPRYVPAVLVVGELVEPVNLCACDWDRVRKADHASDGSRFLGWCDCCGWTLPDKVCRCGALPTDGGGGPFA